MSEVFLVCQGEYSDYHVCGVFSTREKAEAHIVVLKQAEWHDDPEIETWVVDERAKDVYQELHWAQIRISDGAITYTCSRWDTEPPNYTLTHVHCLPYAHYIEACSAKGREHAKKLAVEARQKYMREKGLTEESLKAASRREEERHKQAEAESRRVATEVEEKRIRLIVEGNRAVWGAECGVDDD